MHIAYWSRWLLVSCLTWVALDASAAPKVATCGSKVRFRYEPDRWGSHSHLPATAPSCDLALEATPDRAWTLSLVGSPVPPGEQAAYKKLTRVQLLQQEADGLAQGGKAKAVAQVQRQGAFAWCETEGSDPGGGRYRGHLAVLFHRNYWLSVKVLYRPDASSPAVAYDPKAARREFVALLKGTSVR